jgi:hypothetical protein
MTTLHTEKTEAFYQRVLKINLDALMHSSRTFGLEEPLEQLRLESEWTADEISYGLEIRLEDALLASIEADVKAGCSMAELGSNGTDEAIQDAWDDATQINNVVVIEHDSLSILQSILERIAAGKELSEGDSEWSAFIGDYLNFRNEVDGCWVETPRQKHDRFLEVKLRREKLNLEEAMG